MNPADVGATGFDKHAAAFSLKMLAVSLEVVNTPDMTSPNVASSSRNARLAVAAALVASALVVSEAADFSPASAANGETCPGGSVAEEFYWQRADGSGARWPGTGLDPATSAQNTGFNIVAPLGSSGVNLTATITDPDNRNEDSDSELVANSSTVSNWDTPLYTKTNGAYGVDYLTAVMGAVDSDETVSYEFQFTRPVLIPEFDVGDVDFIGPNSGGGNDPLHDSFQDEVEVFAERGGNPVSFTFEQGSPGTNQPTITGPNTVAGGVYGAAINGNLAPTDLRGTVYLRANSPVNSFGFNYSNGPADAANDPAAPGAPNEIPNVPAGSTGVSNNHAIRISGFTVCVGILEIGDTVFADYDGDGTQGSGEPGIPGVVIDLKDTAGNLIGTTTTDATGNYNFDQLPPNLDYVIDPQEATLPGVTTWTPSGDVFPGDTTENGTSTVTLTPSSSNVTNADFGYRPAPVTIAGTVWSDPEDDGTVGPRDTGIAGVTVNLYDATGTTVVATTTTDADGNYSFSVQPGSYVIRESQPATYTDGEQDPGTNGSTNGANDDINVSVDFAETSIENDYFEVPGSSIAGTVFEDPNNDGAQTGAPGIPGVTVTLTGTDDGGNPVSLTTTTDGDGNYSFDNLRPGTYTVTETQPSPYTDGIDTPGSAGGSAAVNDVVSGIVLGANVAAVDYDFAELPNPSLSGSVLDENGAPIPGVEIRATDGVTTYTTFTLADGSYIFPSLPPGTYTLTEIQPAGYADVSTSAGSEGGNDATQNVISGIVLVATDTAINYDFVEGYASIAGTVYSDLNDNGVQDPGEPGIANASVTLNGTDPNGAIAPVTLTTDANGNYLFDDLLAGTYVVTEVTPTGYVDGKDANGSTGGTATNPGDRISGITLAADEDATDHDFGEIRPAAISGAVTDENGTPIPGVSMTLTGVDDLGNTITPVVVVTDAAGNYSFVGLRPGTYSVSESQPVGYGDGIETSPTGNISGVNVITNLVVAPGQSLPDNDFVETFSSISGHVFVDVNDDGDYDAGLDIPLSGQRVTLTGTDPNGAITPIVATTDSNGLWVFDDLLAGTYTVTETQPAAYDDGKDTAGSVGGTLANDVVSAIALPAGTDATAYDFGEVPAAVISGNVSDENGGPIGNVTITLTGTDSFGNAITPVVTQTDAFGNYNFGDLAPGTYTVTESQPAGYAEVSTSAGTAGGNDATQNVISGIVIGSTTTAANYDFVEGYSSIAGTVYEDLNDNGVQDSGEPGIGGIDVVLTGTNPDGSITPITVQTDADGNYLFDDLRAGTYVVSEPNQPAGLNDGKDAAGSVGGTATNPGDQISAIALGVDVDATSYDFGEIRPAAISGKVTDENGTPISGVSMTLTGVDDLGNPIAPVVVVTDAAGNYSFTGLRPGAYSVTESQPAGYGNGSETSPTGNVSGVNVITNLVIAAGGSLPNNDFVETFSSIAGTVYVDVNGNGVQDANEPGLPGVTVRLNGTDPNGAITEVVATTGPGGTYLFDNLLAGNYTITETTPTAFNDGIDAAGSAGGTAVNPGDEINSISLPSGTDAVDYDFGEIGTVLSGTVYVDDDRDGAIDPSEDARVGGVTIILLDSGGREVARTTTLPDGSYLFVGIPAGDYRVIEEQPARYGTTTVNQLAVTVPTGGLTGVDFGEDLGAISNLVFDDLNGNGTQDAGEPGVAGVTVKLIDSNGDAIAQTVTASDGTYIFNRLFPDAYRVEFIAPAGRGFARPDVGGDATDSDADWISGVTTVVDLTVDPGSGLVNRRTDVDAGLVVAVIDLGVTISTPSTVVKVGDPVVFSYAPVNNSNVPVTGGIVVKTVLPSAVSIESVSAPGWTVVIDGQTVTLTLNDPSVLPGDPLPPFTVTTKVINSTGSLNATVQIGTADGSTETTFVNNDDAVSIQVAAAAAPTPTPTPGLPRTGTGSMAPTLFLALGFASLGALFVGGTRRRRQSAAS
jgi:large repetitive protein